MQKLLVLATQHGTGYHVGRRLQHDFAGIESVKPDRNELKILSETIFSFNCGMGKKAQSKKVKATCEKYFAKGRTKTVILGCTEFGLMLHDGKFDKVNTIDVLVHATIAKIKPLRG